MTGGPRARIEDPHIDAHVAYLAHLGRRPSSVKQRRWCLERLARWLGHDLLTATYQELGDFVARDGTRGPEARCTEISHLRSFYAWALDQELLASTPAARLRRPNRPRRLPRPMPDVDLRHALATAPAPIGTWLHLAAYGGLRCCEIAPLRGEDYRQAEGVLVLQEMKGGDTGVIAVAPVLAAELAQMPASGWWFTRWDGILEPISAGQLQKHANRWLHDQGITHTMHTVRHWFGTNVYRTSGRDLRLAQEALRHKSPQTTAIYTRVEPTELASVVAGLPLFAPAEPPDDLVA